ncbi:NAD(P)H-hydrate epimerase [Microlunatus flavus]|uniref:Bifunctional NAD(P)H-hydrate repair enzyme n=1 Tax=Microlunatus flavus TaxID=1036181 RepID=A0A1H9ME56_9ACTN|nr:NAD(P)H-hydrate epimerase [Microlunatus flavus]SER21443.1 yjeF C-terminal region, hydroxyethylthiazole kinase-related/yjeF N-terminal region [Microlunatus flavus]
MQAFTVEQVRRMERAAMGPEDDGTLMQRAAAGLAAVVVEALRTRVDRVYGARVLVLVGPGNNGGDALWAGARLARRGVRVDAVGVLGTPHAEGLAALLAAGGRRLERAQLSALGAYDLALDGILGIGGRPGLPDDVADLVDRLADADVPVVAVDLPSGVAADTGAVPGAAVTAAVTVTFGVVKVGHLLEPARSRTGRLVLVDIGLDTSAEEPELDAWDAARVAAAWPWPAPQSDKYAKGVVGVDCGSETYPGAGIMATYGAVHGGAGMVRFLGPESAQTVITTNLPDVVFAPGRVQAHLLGSGWGDRADGTQAVADAVASEVPGVLDADGLRYRPETMPGTWLLTPHAGELARLLGVERSEVEDDPLAAVRAGVGRTGATVLLKGATQLVARPGTRTVELAVPGPAWTGRAGSGDTLGGLCAAVLAAGRPAHEAAVLGASLQAVTAAAHPGPLPPHALAERCADQLGAWWQEGRR